MITIKIFVVDFHQLLGRAGRKGFSEEGVWILFVSNTRDKKYWKAVDNRKIPLDRPISFYNREIKAISEYLMRLVNTGYFESWDQIRELVKLQFSSHIDPLRDRQPRSTPSFFSKKLRKKKRKPISNFEIVEKELFELELVEEVKGQLRLTRLGQMGLQFKLEPAVCSELWNFFFFFTLAELKQAGIITLIEKHYVIDKRGIAFKAAYDYYTEYSFNAIDLNNRIKQAKTLEEIQLILDEIEPISREETRRIIKDKANALIEAQDDLAELEEF